MNLRTERSLSTKNPYLEPSKGLHNLSASFLQLFQIGNSANSQQTARIPGAAAVCSRDQERESDHDHAVEREV